MRVLGIPSRVVTVFNAAHDTDASLTIEEYYSSTGEKLNLSKDSVWLVLCPDFSAAQQRAKNAVFWRDLESFFFLDE